MASLPAAAFKEVAVALRRVRTCEVEIEGDLKISLLFSSFFVEVLLP